MSTSGYSLPKGLLFIISKAFLCLNFFQSFLMDTSSMSTSKHQLCVWIMLPDGLGRRGVLIHPMDGNIHPFLLGSTKHKRGSIPLCEFGCTLVQFVFTKVIFSPLAKMLVVQQYTSLTISNLIGKILTHRQS